MKKRYIIGLVLCCLMIIPLVGCSKKDATTKVTVQTPLQILTGRVNASDTVNTRQDQNITDLSNRITTEIAAVSHYNDAPIIARIGALEAFNLSNWDASLAYLGVRLASLESYNISTRLLALENVSVNSSANISARLRAIEVLLNISTNVSTPTPTPTPIPSCSLVKKPVSIYPINGNMSMPNTSIMFQWQDANASGYEFWFGLDPASLTNFATLDKDVLAYPYPAPLANTYYFWRVVSLSPCGNQSTMWWFKTSP